MTIHYHGTPITPVSAFYQMAGRNFCVSYVAPQDVKLAHDLGQSVMLDNGAFSHWRKQTEPDWPGYYRWIDPWLDYPTTWAVIPDVIDGTIGEQDQLINDWPYGTSGAPVWHMHEPLDRLVRLTDHWPRVCIGSSNIYRQVMSKLWIKRMDKVFDKLVQLDQRLPWIHMLRGMQCVGRQWPFASVDSTDIARNHNRDHNVAWAMSDRWDAIQCPGRWEASE